MKMFMFQDYNIKVKDYFHTNHLWTKIIFILSMHQKYFVYTCNFF